MENGRKVGLESRVLPQDFYIAYGGIKVHIVRTQHKGWDLSHKSNPRLLFCVCVCKKIF